jgi:hypothetical protein
MGNNEKRYVRVGLFVVFLSFTAVSFSQNSIECDLKFISHLVYAGDFKEALFLIDSSGCSSNQLNDSLHYLKGWSLYSLKRLSSSSESLLRVSPASEFYLKSHFFAAYNFTHIGEYDNAKDVLSKIDGNTEKVSSLKNFEIAGISLLQGNRAGYDENIAKINKSLYELTESSDNIQKISWDLKNHKRKSPLLAGVISGIIPGSGKFYAGKKGEGISAFIATAGLGLVTWENYRKNGMNNFKTIAFGTAFAFSYAANIYGAVLRVNILETEYRENVKNSILFNLHIPLRNTFDK